MKDRIYELIKNIKNVFFAYFNNNLLFIIYLVLSVAIGFILRLNTVGDVWAFKPFLCDLTVATIIGSFGYLFKQKNQFIFYLSVLIFFSFLGVINSLYYMFYTSFVYINLIGTLSMLGEVGNSVTSRLELYHVVYVLAPIIYIIFYKTILIIWWWEFIFIHNHYTQS